MWRIVALSLLAGLGACVARDGLVDFPACIINCHASVAINQPQPQPSLAPSGVAQSSGAPARK